MKGDIGAYHGCYARRLKQRKLRVTVECEYSSDWRWRSEQTLVKRPDRMDRSRKLGAKREIRALIR